MKKKDGDEIARVGGGLLATPGLVLRARLATLFGLGRFPLAPGTVASFAALPVAMLLAHWGPVPHFAATSIVIVLAIGSSGAAEALIGRKDPSAVVIDEFAGQLLALIAVPVSAGWYAAGFVLFRLFDILKPFPARRLERLPGGWGIVSDDLVAGLYAGLLLHAARLYLSGPGSR